MPIIDDGSAVTGGAGVDSNHNMKVNTPLTPAQAGFAAMLSEIDDGTVTGVRYTKEAELTEDYRLRVGMDTPVFDLAFESINIPRDRIQQNDTTATTAAASGYLTLNSGASVTSGQGTNIRTYRTFPNIGTFTTYFDFWNREGNPNATNAVSEWGAGYCTGVTAQMTDGVVFRRLSGGQLRAVVINNSVDVSAVDITTTAIPNRSESGLYDPTQVQHYTIALHADEVTFWINDVLVAHIAVDGAFAQPTLSAANLPLMARVYMTGTASAARSLSIGRLNVTNGETQSGKPYGHILSGSGGGAYQIQPGTASGPTVSRGAATTAWPASGTTRTANTWTATTAPAVNSLGGSWLSPAMSTLTLEADYPVFSYANPTGSATLPAKTLYITGVNWGKTVATAAASTSNTFLNYIVTVGGTSSATTQTEAATVVAARGIILDSIPFKATAIVGDFVEGGSMDFSAAPLVVPPGTFLTFTVRPFGAVATNTLVVAGSVAFSGYFE